MTAQDCGWNHSPDEVVAVDRFRRRGQSGYRVVATGAVFPTRAEAEANRCSHDRAGRAERQEAGQ